MNGIADASVDDGVDDGVDESVEGRSVNGTILSVNGRSVGGIGRLKDGSLHASESVDDVP